MQAVVGIIFIVHGWPKFKSGGLKLIGGFGHGLVEVAGGLMLIANFHPKSASLVLGLIMLGAIYFKMSKWKIPFKAENTTGWEFDLVLLAACVAIITMA